MPPQLAADLVSSILHHRINEEMLSTIEPPTAELKSLRLTSRHWEVSLHSVSQTQITSNDSLAALYIKGVIQIYLYKHDFLHGAYDGTPS
jgi:hypothetical protein